MKIQIRILGNIIAMLILLVISTPIYISFLLNIPFIQNFLVKEFSNIASNHLNTTVSIEKIDLDLFYSASISGFYVEDPFEKDTLLYVKNISARLNSLQFNKGLTFSHAKVNGGKFYLNNDSTSNNLNIKAIVTKLKPKIPPKKAFKLNINEIDIDSFSFEYRDVHSLPQDNGINYKDMKLNNISIKARDFRLVTDSINMSIDSLMFTEKSGFQVRNINAENLLISPDEINITKGMFFFENSYANIEQYSMSYKQWDMFDYINKVKMNVDINIAQFNFQDIAKFTPKKQPWKGVLAFKGKASGVISNLEVAIKDVSTLNTTIHKVSGTIKGLPNINNTNFDIKVDELSSSIEDFRKLAYDFTEKKIAFFDKLSMLTSIKCDVKFSGLFENFKTQGLVLTEFGSTEFNLSNRPNNIGIELKGGVIINNFNVGRMFNINKLGNVSLTADMNAIVGTDTLVIDTKAKVIDLTYNKYKYTNLNIDGRIIDKAFYGDVVSEDPNINFDFNGFIDFGIDIPDYNFNLLLNKANLHTLNFNKKDSISILSGKLLANGSGVTLDNMNGKLVIDSVTYINKIDTINIDRATFTTINSANSKLMKFNSEFADIELQGQQSYSNIFVYLVNSMKKYLPSIQEGAENYLGLKNKITNENNRLPKESEKTLQEEAKNGYYVATVNVKKANNVASIFVPTLKIAEGTNLHFVFNPGLNEFSFNFSSDYLSFNKSLISNIVIDSKALQDSISIYARTKEMTFNNIYIPNFLLLGGIKNNSVSLESRFFNADDKSEAFISTHSIFDRDPETGVLRLRVSMLPSRFSLGGDKWNLSPGEITLEPEKIIISEMSINSKGKEFKVAGVMSSSVQDTLKFSVKNFDISPLTILTKDLGYKISGIADGKLGIASMFKTPHLITDLNFYKVKLNDKEFKSALFRSDWSESENATIFSLKQQDAPPIIKGVFKIKKRELVADVNIDKFDISLISPFTKSIFSDVEGDADINVKVSNLNNKLQVNGKVNINKFVSTIGFTKVKYEASGLVTIDGDNHFKLHNGILKDELGTESSLNAELWGKNFKRVRYSINAKPNKMLCLNTTIKDNETFYGRIFGSGDLKVIGHGVDVVMNVNATTENNSTFFMPLSGKSSIQEADFITFVGNKESIKEEKKRSFINVQKKDKEKSKGSFAMNINLDVRPNIEAQIVIDPTVGDIIKGRASGNLAIKVDPSNNIMNIDGGVEIIEGSYLLTLSNIINKYFKIQPGSTINWTGDPLGANLNITATYLVKTSLAPLMGDQFSRRVEVDCNLHLTGNLLKPNIKMGILIPSAETEVQSYVNSILNTEDAISKQWLSLLVTNTFYTDESSTTFNSTGLTTGVAVTGLEFLSNQLSNWISTDKFNIGFNYRPRGEMTSDELELRVLAPILKDKLFLDVEGNYNFKNNPAYITENTKNLTADVSLTWKIDDKDNLVSKVFTRPIETFDENQGLQETGVGIYYTYSFNKFSDIIKAYKKNLSIKRTKLKKKRHTIKHETENYNTKIKRMR